MKETSPKRRDSGSNRREDREEHGVGKSRKEKDEKEKEERKEAEKEEVATESKDDLKAGTSELRVEEELDYEEDVSHEDTLSVVVDELEIGEAGDAQETEIEKQKKEDMRVVVRSAMTERSEEQNEEDIIMRVGRAEIGMTRKVKIVMKVEYFDRAGGLVKKVIETQYI